MNARWDAEKRIADAMKDYAEQRRRYDALRKEQEFVNGNWELAKAAEARVRAAKIAKDQEVGEAARSANNAMESYINICRDEAVRLADAK